MYAQLLGYEKFRYSINMLRESIVQGTVARQDNDVSRYSSHNEATKVCMNVSFYIYIYVYSCVWICIHLVYIYMYTYICIYVYVYIYTSLMQQMYV
jgi:hypothetical protein